MFRRPVATLLLGLSVTIAAAAPTQPPDPEAWTIHLRYGIFAFRTERLRQYAEMSRALKEAGFVRAEDDIPADDEPDNSRATRLRGTIPASGVERLLSQRHVRAVLLYPKGTKLPDKGRVRIEVRLPSGFLAQTQRALFQQMTDVLKKDTGFMEAIGYDHRGATRLVGSVPAEKLDALVEDVRQLPSAKGLPAPLANVSPVRLVIARPDWPVPVVRPAPPAVPAGQEKLSADLRALLVDAAAAKSPGRLEVILASTADADTPGWRRALEATGVRVEGRLGSLVSVRGVPGETAAKLAGLPEVVTVRLPRLPLPVPAIERWELLRGSGPAGLLSLSNKGRGARIAIVADDFSGWQKLDRGRVTLFDLTAERNRDLTPDASPPSGKEPGAGTRTAARILQTLPEAELTLVHIDPQAPYMLQELAWVINGSTPRSIALADRLRELQDDRTALDLRGEELQQERQRVLADAREEEEPIKQRQAYLARQVAFDRDLDAYRARLARYNAYLRDRKALRGIRHVATTLVWADGHPSRADSGLSMYFDERPFRAASWFRPMAGTAGQVWTGLFRDADDNGVMEFASPIARLPAGAWTREVNFLGWRRVDGKLGEVIPADARLRLTLQWREPHDPLPARLGEDPYRAPLANLKLVVVHQPDPDGKGRPADDLEVVAELAGPARRLEQTAGAATYEVVIDLRVPKAGRYGVFIEGRLPDSVLPPGESRLPGTRKFGELRTRLAVHSPGGQPAWRTFAAGD